MAEKKHMLRLRELAGHVDRSEAEEGEVGDLARAMANGILAEKKGLTKRSGDHTQDAKITAEGGPE